MADFLEMTDMDESKNPSMIKSKDYGDEAPGGRVGTEAGSRRGGRVNSRMNSSGNLRGI